MIVVKYLKSFTLMQGDEKIRMSLFKLRNTWPQYFPTAFLHKLDLAVKELDPNWPIEKISPPSGSIHINPKFLRKVFLYSDTY